MASLIDLYQKLNKNIKKEKEFIKTEAYEELKAIIDNKNDLIKKITAKEEAIKAGKEDKLKETEFAELKEILTAASKSQKENLELLSQKQGETKAKLLKLYGRQKSIKGYHNPGQQEAKFFDQKS